LAKTDYLFFKSTLEREHSKANSLILVDYVIEDPKRFKTLVEILESGDLILHQRGAYIMYLLGEKHADLIIPFLPRLLKLWPNALHEAYLRALTRTLWRIKIPKKFQGEIADRCFTALENPKAPIAIRAHCMSVLLEIGREEPELLNELEFLINEYYDESSAGYRSRAKHVFKEIAKIKKSRSHKY